MFIATAVRRVLARSGRVRPVFALALIGCAFIAAAASAQQRQEARQLFRYISPRPGAELVSPGTTIAVRPARGAGASLAAAVSFSVRGSQSGYHEGTVILADDRQTVIFDPERPFARSEIVRVTIDAGRAFAATGGPGAFSYQFRVAPPPPDLDEGDDLAALLGTQAPSTGAIPAPAAAFTATQEFFTVPDDFPVYEVTTSEPGTGAGYVFIGYFGFGEPDLATPYLLMIDNDGQPVYYQRLADRIQVLDFKKQPNGLLTYFDRVTDERKFVAMDDSYTIVGTYAAGNGYETDGHDLQLLDNGNALLLIHDSQVIDMSQLVPGGNPAATVIGCIVQELDPSGNVLFQWSSWDHISILDSNQDLTEDSIRYIHCNSVAQDFDGNILISSRHLDELTKIDRQTGDIIWRLGGPGNDFTFTNDPGFFYQHDARRLPNGHITLYDNRTNQIPEYSRGVEYMVDEQNMTVTRVWQYRNTPDTYGRAMGDDQRLPGGNSLIGWGATNGPMLTEALPDGTKVFEVSAPPPNVSYRVFRFPWQGDPQWPPTLVARADGSAINLYFSWNGATDIASYRIYADQTPEPATLLATVAKAGFETSYVFDTPEDGLYYLRVMPIDGNGSETQYSNTVAVVAGSVSIHLPFIAHDS